MQEEYGIKLKILTDALKGSISQVKGMIHSFSNDVKRDTNINFKINPELNAEELNSEINRAKEILEGLNWNLQFDKNLGNDTAQTEQDIANVTKYVTLAKERLKELSNIPITPKDADTAKEKIKEVGNEAEKSKTKISGISISASMTNNNIVNGFQKSWNSIKKFGFALLSIRGIYGLVRKASSADNVKNIFYCFHFHYAFTTSFSAFLLSRR